MTTAATSLYFVRHADSPYIPGEERARGLSERGHSDALRVSLTLGEIRFDAFLSSPYERAIQTIRPLAGGQPILEFEDLREREIGEISGTPFYAAKQQVYQDFGLSFPKGESSQSAQQRAVAVIVDILRARQGQNLLIGTHGDIMTLIFNYFDPAHNFEFWQSTSMPDIYRLAFQGERFIQINRLWQVE
ncbi:histidine phosphatase family protein [Cohnella sp. GCM10012308]|uniref:histidine phosphatase family protein n=1 Tax=Cohnella sp. GCM10012308 TaxID=3317329 RepID=UPI0036094107